MSFLSKLMGVVQVAAPIVANVVLPGSGGILSSLMNGVLDDNNHGREGLSEEDKAEIIAASPELVSQLEAKAMALEEKIMKSKVENMGQVNEVIKAELVSGKWYQRAWRPFNGFMFPISVLAIYVIVPVAKVLLIGKYPLLLTLSLDVPPSLWMVWGGILGIAVHGRNKEKVQGQGKVAGVVKGLIGKLIK